MLVNEEQQQIADAVRSFAQERLRPFAEQWDKDHRFPREAIEEMAALGLFGMLVPEQWGGSDTGYVAYAMALEEIAVKMASLRDKLVSKPASTAAPTPTTEAAIA